MTDRTSKTESFTVGALRARFADESMPWTRPHVESLINQLAELTKQRDEGWDNFYRLRKRVAEEKYPGMTTPVRALAVETNDAQCPDRGPFRCAKPNGHAGYHEALDPAGGVVAWLPERATPMERCRSGLGYQGEFLTETQCTLNEGHSGPHQYATDPRT